MLRWRWTERRGELAACSECQAPACEIMRRRPAAPNEGSILLPPSVEHCAAAAPSDPRVLATRACFLWRRTTAANPGKLLKKLRKQRMAATKGIVKGQK